MEDKEVLREEAHLKKEHDIQALSPLLINHSHPPHIEVEMNNPWDVYFPAGFFTVLALCF